MKRIRILHDMKIPLFMICGIGFVLGCVTQSLAQDNAYTDDFSGALLYSPSSGFQLTLVEETLLMRVKTSQVWQGQYFSLGQAKDFRDAPYLSVKLRTLEPCLLTAYMFSTAGGNWTSQIRIFPSEEFVEYYIDFSHVPMAERNKIHAIQFTPNGFSNGYSGDIYVDDLKIGAAAQKLANLGALRTQRFPVGSRQRSLRIPDISNATAITVAGAESLLENVQVSPLISYTIPGITGSFSTATITFDCRDGASGTDFLAITAVGAAGYLDNTQRLEIEVQANAAPYFDPVPDQSVPVGQPRLIRLSGVTDGNSAMEQELIFTVGSDNPAVISGGEVVRAKGSPYATFTITPRVPGTARITVTAEDGLAFSRSFQVQAFAAWNEPPTLDALENREIFLGTGDTAIPLTGISDGGEGDQTLQITARADNPAIISSATIQPVGKDYYLVLTPAAEGTTQITVTVLDDGGRADNNGHQSISRTFAVTVRLQLPDSHVSDLDSHRDRWVANNSITVTFPQEDGVTVLRGSFSSKSTWDGLDYNHPDVDLSEYPVVAFDFKADKDGQLTMFVWDNITDDPAGLHYNTGHNIVHSVKANQWKSYTFDFRTPNGMSSSNGIKLNSSWITHSLINFHSPALSWPFTSVSGNYWIKNFRIGKAALPAETPVCRMDPISDRWHFQSPGLQSIAVTGIGSGSSEAPSVAISSNNPSLFQELSISAPDPQGSATLVYDTGEAIGEATVTVTVSAPGSTSTAGTFLVKILPKNPDMASVITIDASKTFQTIHGFGCFLDTPGLADEYTQELGGSAMRVGLIGNQIEPYNDNNDPEVLDRSQLNYQAFDWAYLRALKARGVENFILSSWSPPAWMKDNLSGSYGMAGVGVNTNDVNNRLAFHYYDEFAESMVAVYRLFQEEAGIDLLGIGLQNEPVFHEPYESAILDPVRFVQLIKVVGARLEKEGISCHLYMPEQVFSQGINSMAQYIAELNKDPTAMKYAKVIATHGYADDGVGAGQPNFTAWRTMYNQAQGGGVAKELWMTETYPEYRTYDDALNYAAYLYGALEYGNINLWTSWSYVGQFRKDGLPTFSLYTFSQFARYIRPGAVRLHSAAPANLLVTSYRNDAAHGGKDVTVLTNQQNTHFVIKLAAATGGALPAAYQITRTDAKSRHVALGVLASDDLLILPPRSVTTLVGQNTPVAQHPPVIMADLAAEPSTVYGLTTTLSLTAADADDDLLQLTWSLLSGPEGASVIFGSGNQTTATNGAAAANSVTFTRAGTYRFRVLLTDGHANLSSRTVEVLVEPTPTTLTVNPDSISAWAGQTVVLEAEVKDQFARVINDVPIEWSALSGSFSNTSGTSTVFTAPPVNGPVTITAGWGMLSDTCVVQVTIPSNPPVITLTALAEATLARSYNKSISYSGGEGTLTWEITAGRLPQGMSFSSVYGRISGVPKEAGRFPLTVRVTDSRGVSDVKTLTLTVIDPAIVPQWDLSSLPSGATEGWLNHWYGFLYYLPALYPWTYHADHGWIYPYFTGSDDSAFWCYAVDEWNVLEWQYIHRNFYPFIYALRENDWVYYEMGSHPPKFWRTKPSGNELISLHP